MLTFTAHINKLCGIKSILPILDRSTALNINTQFRQF